MEEDSTKCSRSGNTSACLGRTPHLNPPDRCGQPIVQSLCPQNLLHRNREIRTLSRWRRWRPRDFLPCTIPIPAITPPEERSIVQPFSSQRSDLEKSGSRVEERHSFSGQKLPSMFDRAGASALTDPLKARMQLLTRRSIDATFVLNSGVLASWLSSIELPSVHLVPPIANTTAEGNTFPDSTCRFPLIGRPRIQGGRDEDFLKSVPRLMEQMKDGIAVLWGNSLTFATGMSLSISTEQRLLPDGIDEEDCALVLTPGGEQGDFHLFCVPDPARETWDGPMIGLTAKEIRGDNAHPIRLVGPPSIPMAGRATLYAACDESPERTAHLFRCMTAHRTPKMKQPGPDTLVNLESHGMRSVKANRKSHFSAVPVRLQLLGIEKPCESHNGYYEFQVQAAMEFVFRSQGRETDTTRS